MKLTLCCAIACLLTSFSLFAAPGVFVDEQGRRFNGDVTVDTEGNAVFKGGDGVPKRYRKGTYRYIKLIPMPDDLLKYQQLFEAKKYDTVCDSATRLYQTYRYYGYGEFVAYYEAQSLIIKAREEAKIRKEEFNLFTDKRLLQTLDIALSRGLLIKNDNNEFYYKCLEMQLSIWLVQPTKVEDANEKLEKLLLSTDMEEVFVAIKAKGDYHKNKGDKEKAVAEYTKILLYIAGDDVKLKAKREMIKKDIISLLGINNPRVATISAL